MKDILAFEYLYQEQVPQKYIENFRHNNPHLNHWSNFDINNYILKFLESLCFKSPFVIEPPLESEERKRYDNRQTIAYGIYTERCSNIFNNDTLDQTLHRFTSGEKELRVVVNECVIQLNECAEIFNSCLFDDVHDIEYERFRSRSYIPSREDFDFYTDYLYDLKQYRKTKEQLPATIRNKAIEFASDTKEYLKDRFDASRLPSKQNECNSPTPTFDELFKSDDDKKFVMDLMKELRIINADGECILSEKRRSALLGIVNALRDKQIIPNHSEKQLLQAVTSHIKTYYSRLKSESKTYTEYYKKSLTAISKKGL